MSNSPGFRPGNISSAVPNSLSSSPNSGTLFQRTCHTALVNCVLLSSSIDLSLSRKVAKPLVAVFGSLITDPTAVTTRGRLPSSAASCRPSVFSVRKLCRRKNASATKPYVASSLGQQMTDRAVAVCAHHNQISINRVCLAQNFFGSRACRFVHCYVDVFLRDGGLPLHQL